MPQLSFAAHMLGTTQGSLHVDVLSGGRWYLDVALPLSGNKGSSWINVSTSLMPFNGQTIVLRFRGQTGTGQSSDIAIDAVSISEVTSAPQAAIQPQTGSVCLNQVVALFDASVLQGLCEGCNCTVPRRIGQAFIVIDHEFTFTERRLGMFGKHGKIKQSVLPDARWHAFDLGSFHLEWHTRRAQSGLYLIARDHWPTRRWRPFFPCLDHVLSN
jgi:hypothetical protein